MFVDSEVMKMSILQVFQLGSASDDHIFKIALLMQLLSVPLNGIKSFLAVIIPPAFALLFFLARRVCLESLGGL
jgi:uncharacterized protein (DUF2344 family)